MFKAPLTKPRWQWDQADNVGGDGVDDSPMVSAKTYGAGWGVASGNALVTSIHLNEIVQILPAPATEPPLTAGALGLSITDTSDHIINATESTSVAFTVSGLAAGATGTATFTDAANHQVAVNVDANGSYTADLSTLLDGTISSSLLVAGSSGHNSTTSGNAVTLDTDSALTPTVVVDAANPANVTFTISGLEGDETGTMTFTDTLGHSDVVNIGSNGIYSTNLSDLTNGTLTYLVSVTDPVGNVTTFDPTVTLGDGSANAPAGTPQVPHLLDGYTIRPPWMVAGVDYAVGVPSGTALKNPLNITDSNIGVDTAHHLLWVQGNNVTLSGYDFTGWTVYVQGGSQNTTIQNSYFGPHSGVYGDPTSVNVTIQYCEFTDPTTSSSLITLSGTGSKIVQYNFLHDSGQHFLELNNGGAVNYSFNLIENGAETAGAHLNVIQFQAGASNSSYVNPIISYNTIVQTPQVSAGEEIQLYNPGAGISNGLVSNNTMLAIAGPGATASVSYMINAADPATTGVIRDNYMYDAGGGAFGFFYPNTPAGIAVSNNIDMATGKIIQRDNTEVAGSPPPGPSGAPVISSFSTDSGTVGDHITNDNTLTLTGAAAANSTVTFFDGSTQIGTTTANASGAWNYTTATLANGVHSLSATATVSGTTSAASTALSVTVDTVAPTAPVISSNAVSASNVVTLTGTAEANSTVKVFDGSTQIGTATANVSGAWSFATAALPAGSHSFTAKDTDTAGNVSAVSSTLNLTLTTAVPADLVVQTTSWSNLAFPTQTTNFTASFDAAPSQSGEDVVIGLAAANAADFTDLAAVVRFNSTNTIDVRNGAGYGADVSVPYNAGTNYHFRMVVNLSAHTYSVYVTPQGGSEIALATNYAFRTEQATDSSLSDIGGFSTSGSASVFNFSVTGALPGAPTITSFSSDSGTAGDHITNDNTLTLTGTAVANSTVTFFDGSTQIGTTTANASGAWNYTSATLANGVHSLTATATVSGTTSAASTALHVTVDATAPVAPSIASFSTDTGTVGDGVTSDNTLTLTGTAEANSTVKIYDGATLLGNATANGSGAWSYTTAALASGAHSFTSTATDAAGNTGAPSTALSVTIDATAPTGGTPDLVAASDSGTSTTDNITDITNPTFTIALNPTVAVGDTVQLLVGGSALAHNVTRSITSADITAGSVSLAVTASDLGADGSKSISAKFTDAAGNSTTTSALAVTLDTTAPTVASVAASGAGISNGQGALNAGDVVALTLNLSAAVTVTGGTPTLTLNDSGTATYTGGSGTNILTFSYTVAAGQNTSDLTVTAVNLNSATVTDAAGNAANLAGAVTNPIGALQIDTTAPVAPSIASFSTDSGTVGDHTTNDTTLILTGTAEANSTVKVYDGATLLGNAAVNGSGAWTYTTAALANGAHSLTARTTDVAGNAGAASAALAVTVDTVAPNVPVITSDAVVNTNEVLLTGTAEAGSTVKIFEGAILLGTAMVNGTGAWSYTTSPLADGAHTFTATSTDAAGNTSLASQYIDPVVGTGTVIDSNGATSLNDIANHYYLLDSTGTGPSLKYGGADYVVGQFSGWTPIGAEKTATGYEVAWHNTSTGQYTVWSTDTNGNYVSNIVAVGSGTGVALESIETGFHQDLNGDGAIGLPPMPTTVIESTGATSLTEIGSNFYLYDSTHTGPSLKYGGMDYVVGQFSGWTPIGAEKTASGYEVAWHNTSTGQYTVWSTDSSGNYVSNIVAVGSGTSAALESIETSFHQDLNSDGAIGLPPMPTTVIESTGAASLTDIANHYYLLDTANAGVTLKYGGSDYADGQFGAWTPIGAEKTASGYEVAWHNTSTGDYTVWSTDSSGNYVSNIVAVGSGTSVALESIETSFHQDLNGDGTIGLPPMPTTVIESTGATSLTDIANHYYLLDTANTGVTLKYGGSDYADGQFGAWTPIGAEKTATGYEVAWHNTSTGQYTVWSADSNGNYVSNIVAVGSATSAALESIETSFNQDLNGDGYKGLVLNGSSGGQTLTAGSAPTTLIGGPSDILNGGAGADTFVFPANFGSNTVNNFTPNTDALQFSQSMFATVAAVLSDAQQVGSNVVITHDAQNMVTLQNMQLTNLHASDIHIV